VAGGVLAWPAILLSVPVNHLIAVRVSVMRCVVICALRRTAGYLVHWAGCPGNVTSDLCEVAGDANVSKG
jgi:hypothetical protein